MATPFDIAQIMPMLQAQQAGGMGMNPLGALNLAQPGVGGMGAMGAPDFNAILQQRMVDMNAQRQAMQQQRMAQMADMFGQRTGGAMQFDPTMGMQGMRQQFRDWRQAQPQGSMKPMGFQRPDMGAAGGPRPDMGATAGPMVGQAQIASGLGAGNSGGGQFSASATPAGNINPDLRKQRMGPY